MTSDDAERVIKSGESNVVGLVADPADFAAISADVCAFLNTHGGIVFVGADGDGDIRGVGADPEAVRRDLEMRLQAEISPKALFTVSVDIARGLPVIAIATPAGRDGPYTARRKYFVRRGKKSVEPSDEVLDQIIREQSIEAQRWERRTSVGLDEDDLSADQIASVREDASVSGRVVFPENDTIGILRKLGLTTPQGFTHACDVLFAQTPEQRHPQCRLRFVRYESNKAADEYIDNDWITGPLVSVYNQTIERLSGHVRIQALFKPGESQRKDRPNYSLDALREGLINALAHRDYSSFSSGVSVSVYPSRIEIWNSGQLPRALKVADLKKSHPSIPTNPDIAYVLYLHKLMERLGRGTQRIIRACQELGSVNPKWESKASGVTLTIHSALANAAEALSLNDRQNRLIGRLQPGDAVKVVDYIAGEDGGVSERQARRDLAELEAAGLLTKVGNARATTYRRSDRTV